MKKSMRAWPEINFLDGTYKLFDNGLILSIIMVEDSNGQSNFGAIGLLASETEPVVHWFLETFKKDNQEACQNIKCFMADKDFVSRRALKKLFPGVPVYICIFHTLQAMKRAITKESMGLKTEDIKTAIALMKKLAYSTSEEQYFKNYEKLQTAVGKNVLDYFNKNWHCIRSEWTVYSMINSNFLNYTNNRLESLNGKIKQVIRKLSSLMDFLRSFFTFILVKDMQVDAKAAFNILKVKTGFEVDSIEEKYMLLVTDQALIYILDQLKVYKSVKIKFDASHERIIKDNGVTLKVTSTTCDCGTWSSLLLPCRHIFAIRQALGVSLFDKDLCNHRWTKDYLRETQRVFNATNDTVSTPLPLLCELERPCLESVEGRLNVIKPLIEIIITSISNSCGNAFTAKLETIQELKSFWENNTDVSVIETVDSSTVEASLNHSLDQLQITKSKNGKRKPLTVTQKRKIVKLCTNALIELCKSTVDRSLIEKKVKILEEISAAFSNGLEITLVRVADDVFSQDPSKLMVSIHFSRFIGNSIGSSVLFFIIVTAITEDNLN